MRIYFPQELDEYLKQFGFEIAYKFGSFEEEGLVADWNNPHFEKLVPLRHRIAIRSIGKK
jgi:hypothetical protein